MSCTLTVVYAGAGDMAAPDGISAYMPVHVVREGASAGPLKGYTFAVKDLYDVRSRHCPPCLVRPAKPRHAIWCARRTLACKSSFRYRTCHTFSRYVVCVCQRLSLWPATRTDATHGRRWKALSLDMATPSGLRATPQPRPTPLLSRWVSWHLPKTLHTHAFALEARTSWPCSAT